MRMHLESRKVALKVEHYLGPQNERANHLLRKPDALELLAETFLTMT